MGGDIGVIARYADGSIQATDRWWEEVYEPFKDRYKFC